MARRKKGNPVHGWVLVDKPLHLTSTQIVGKIRRLFNAQKAGHGGTLDPLASGVLPIALGEATKTVPFIMDGQKIYEFDVTWGVQRETDDFEGDIIKQSDLRPSQAEIDQILPKFRGRIAQVPPIFSAIKVNGQRAYDLARAKQDVTLSAREVFIEKLERIDSVTDTHDSNIVPSEDQDAQQITSFRLICGKGTYVRSLARDMGEILGCYGYVSRLRRVKVGPFLEMDTISLDVLEQLGHTGALETALTPIQTALDGIPAVFVSEQACQAIQHGRSIPIEESYLRQLPEDSKIIQNCDGADAELLLLCHQQDQRALALAKARQNHFAPVRVFNL